MNAAPDPQALPEPELRPRRRWSLSLIWLVPLVAAIAGAVLIARAYLLSGPTIDISFETAEGLEAGKTEVRYKNVVIGKVEKIVLSKDHSQITAYVGLSSTAKGVAVNDTRFWVERPRVSIGGISGIGTLLSGAYIGVDIGSSGQEERHFKGLEKPPPVTHDQKGRRFILHAADAGSLAIGAPVYYRKIAVGSVVASDLDADGKNITVQVFVNAPNDHLVTADTRFWNASGVDVALGATGLKLNTQSLATVVAGGIAFQVRDENQTAPPAASNAEFTLFADQVTALAPPDGPPLTIRMRFRQSTRGLSLGAPVDFQGITLGTVKSALLDFDRDTKRFYTDVSADIFPERLGPAYNTLKHSRREGRDLSVPEMFARMIEHGLRAQLRAGNLLTGQLYVALDFVKGAAAAKADSSSAEVEIPTAPGSLQELQTQIQDIVHKLDDVPFDQIGNNLSGTLKNANSLLRQLDRELAPEAKKTLAQARRSIESLDQGMLAPDAPLQVDAHRTLDQLNRAAQSLRALADYLEQHPESLIRGKPEVPVPDGGSDEPR